MAFEIAAQEMQPPARRVHILRGFGVVQRGKLQSQFVRMVRLDFRLRSCLEEPLDTLVPEALIIVYSVYLYYTDCQTPIF
jgi:hypothetical protein